jgi:hypothetical protein
MRRQLGSEFEEKFFVTEASAAGCELRGAA